MAPQNNNNTNELFLDIVSRLSRIEAQLEAQQQLLAKMEERLIPLVEAVHRNSMFIRAFLWILGLTGSFFTAKIFGKF